MFGLFFEFEIHVCFGLVFCFVWIDCLFGLGGDSIGMRTTKSLVLDLCSFNWNRPISIDLWMGNVSKAFYYVNVCND